MSMSLSESLKDELKILEEMTGMIPRVVPLHQEKYDELCEELNMPYIDIIHGVQITRGDLDD